MTTQPKRKRLRITPEEAARIREEDEACAAAITAAHAVLNAAAAAANATIAAARARHRAAQLTILRRYHVDDDATLVSIDSRGATTTLQLDLPVRI